MLGEEGSAPHLAQALLLLPLLFSGDERVAVRVAVKEDTRSPRSSTPALFHQETVAARSMLERVEKLGVQPESVGAYKAFGSGEFLDWLLKRGVQPHIPVIDRRH